MEVNADAARGAGSSPLHICGGDRQASGSVLQLKSEAMVDARHCNAVLLRECDFSS